MKSDLTKVDFCWVRSLLSRWWAKCDDCGEPLTIEEIHYYENRCNDCELAWSHRISYWMDGGPDPELDRLYENSRPR